MPIPSASHWGDGMFWGDSGVGSGGGGLPLLLESSPSGQARHSSWAQAGSLPPPQVDLA